MHCRLWIFLIQNLAGVTTQEKETYLLMTVGLIFRIIPADLFILTCMTEILSTVKLSKQIKYISISIF